MSDKSDVIAVIPARGGSKRIPGKNLLPLAGLPLVAHSIRHAVEAESVVQVYVSTDDPKIAEAASYYGSNVIKRPLHLANDTASSESAVLDVLDQRNAAGLDDPELVVFLQCTSPVREHGDIDGAVRLLRERRADSVFSGSINKQLFWRAGEDGPTPINYDFQRRQREQEMPTQYLENGSIFVFKPALLRENDNRMGGKVEIFEMDHWSSFQIDEPEDVALIEWIMQRRRDQNLANHLPERIDLVVFDFDGVMTDNTVQVDQTGRESVKVNRADGLGIDGLRNAGVPMLVLSTEKNPVVAARCDKLRMECAQGIDNKVDWLVAHCAKQNIDLDHVVYLGNDNNDLGCLARVGYPIAVADAYPDVLAKARHVLQRNGGKGAVRELADAILARRRGD